MFCILFYFYESFTLLKQVLKYLFIIFMCMHEFMCTTCIQEPAAAQRGHWILWSWNCKVLSATCVC